MSGSLELAQARLQARHGLRPSAAAWSALHAAVAMPALLEAARTSAFRPWTAGLESAGSPGEIERVLRERLRARIDEVAGWMPEDWRDAVAWTAKLLDFPGQPHTADTRAQWLEEFRALWPSCAGADREAMEELVRLLQSHVATFVKVAPDDAWPRRLALQARLQWLFRKHALTPAAAFAHLAIVALDLERLRAEIVAHEGLARRLRADRS